ncbi:hypothetical protein BC833DRAFT_553544 [Globomyces pollinis-pini]|nr:hypothetical protein BC833DRAFT_553544 [Globomyces pollinis-pini]
MSKLKKYRNLLEPFPIELKANKSRGRYIVTQKTITPGETLLIETPTAYTILKSCNRIFCNYCCKKINPNVGNKSTPKLFGIVLDNNDTITCMDCRQQSFWCSNECQMNDKIHTLTCRYIAQLPGIAGSTSTDYNLLRLILNIIAHELLEYEEKTAGETPHACLMDLLSHQRSYDVQFLDSVRAAATDIYSLFQEENSPLVGLNSIEEIVKLACRINSNSHAIHDPSGIVTQPIGVGMFPLVAMLNHSCSPNAVFVTGKDGTMIVQSTKLIKEGEEICVSYTDIFAPRWERQGKLLTSKFFWCSCLRCMDDSADKIIDGFKCSNCNDGYLYPSNDSYICSCGLTQSTEDMLLKTRKIGIDDAMDIYRAGMFDSAEMAFKQCLEVASDILHPYNHLYLMIYVNLTTLTSRQSKFLSAIEYCEKSIAVMEEIAAEGKMGQNILELANLYEQYGQLLEISAEAIKEQLVQGDESMAIEFLNKSAIIFDKVKNIRTVCYGPNNLLLHG